MTNPKFSSRLQVWVQVEIAAAFEALAASGELQVSDHLRLALSNHLRALGIHPAHPATTRPAPNGAQHEETRHGV